MIMRLRSLFREPQREGGFFETERWERKFYLPSSMIPFAAHLLAHCCPSDRQYPRSVVHSIYYDTADLEHFEDSEQGSRRRKKVRIRWYDGACESAGEMAVFLELKSKNGYAGSKQRKKHSVHSPRRGISSMRNGLLPYPLIFRTLAEFGYTPQTLLNPVILISYQRLRFTEMTTGSRVSLDWNIRSWLITPMHDRREGPLRMEGGVLEIKGQSDEIPPALQSIRFLQTDWSRYSKYASCMQSQLEDAGSVGRFFPSGRVETIE